MTDDTLFLRFGALARRVVRSGLLPGALLAVPLLVAVLLGAPSARAQADVPVSLPNRAGLAVDDTVDVPVRVGAALPEMPEVRAFDVRIGYDPAVVSFVDTVVTEGTLAEAFGSVQVGVPEAGQIRLAAAEGDGAPLPGESGSLVVLEAVVQGEGRSSLTFDFFQFNEGDPAAALTDGVLTTDEEFDPAPGVVVNEILSDPPSGGAGDANGDGTRGPEDDEFVEIANNGDAPIDLGGYRLSDSEGRRHVFPEGTRLTVGQGVVVFGGGSPIDFPGYEQTASTGELLLDNDGDVVLLEAPTGVDVARLPYGTEAPGGPDAAADQSLARQPDFTGAFVPHTQIGFDRNDDGTPDAYSPGFENDSATPLPVEFAGAPTPTVEGRDVVLTWRTLTETNNAGFYVQRKRKGTASWTRASALVPTKAEGDASGEGHTYRYRVMSLAPGRYRFRIRQEDRDGVRSAGPATALVEVGLEKQFSLHAPAPNPLRPGETARLPVSVPEGEAVEGVLYNSLGQQVRRLEASGAAVTVRAEDLASGLYFVRIETDSGRTATQQVTLVR
jgi:hypothetical protein